MAETTAQGSGSTNNNTGAVYTGGTIGSNRPLSKVSLGVKPNGGIALTQDSGMMTGLKGTSTTLTSVADSGGKCEFTLTSHGLVVGDVIEITGATASSLNTVHNVTSKTDDDFVTDVDFATSATAGDFQKLTGTRNKLSDYIIPTGTDSIAGQASTVLSKSGGFGNNSSGIKRSVTERRYDVTSWDYVTGAKTSGANAGDSYTFKAASGSGTVDEESVGIGDVVIHEGNPTPYSRQYESIFD